MANDNRTIKPISFSHDDAYEDDLYNFAIADGRGAPGKFGPYIKRLIEWHRSGRFDHPAPNVVPSETADEDREAVGGFL